jgi:biopolymer transport protein ExbB
MRSREEVRERVEDVGRHLVHRMERFLNTLGTIASAGPLLGLFGTVVGMIEMFLGILDHGIGDASQLAGGIGKALVCTATGMLVAIPALAFHRYFRGRISGYIVDMEHEAIRLMDVLDAPPGSPAPAAATPRAATPKKR